MFPIFFVVASLYAAALDAVGADVRLDEHRVRACGELERFSERVACRREQRGAPARFSLEPVAGDGGELWFPPARVEVEHR